MPKLYDPIFDRDDFELEKFALFSIAVANKNADITMEKVEDFVAAICQPGETPFQSIRELDNLGIGAVEFVVNIHRISPYKSKSKGFIDIARSGVDLRTCSVEQLESIHGIGPKTARYFVAFSRENTCDIAILDTHILKWLGEKGHDVPTSTPTGKKYKELEQLFLSYWRKQDLPLAQFDYNIWQEMRNGNDMQV